MRRSPTSFVELIGIEPTTSSLRTKRSPKLSYSPIGLLYRFKILNFSFEGNLGCLVQPEFNPFPFSASKLIILALLFMMTSLNYLEICMDTKSAESLFSEYLLIIQRLRKECPWDRKQTHESLRAPLLEETYEVIDAITQGKNDHLRNELGDLLLHIALQSEIATEEKAFTMADVIQYSIQKMIRRHPHIFGNAEAEDEHEVKKNWEAIKRQEGKTSILDGVPQELPALIRAQRTQEKASVIGFDWKKREDVWRKVMEEVEELNHAEESGNPDFVEQEFGDLLFALVNYSRFIGTNAEFALRKSVDRFGRRFHFIEQSLQERGKRPSESSLDEMDSLWEEAKKRVG